LLTEMLTLFANLMLTHRANRDASFVERRDAPRATIRAVVGDDFRGGTPDL
jgi:hypothetical protein